MDLGWEIMIRQEDGTLVWHARPWLDDRDDDDDWDGPGALTAGSAEDLDGMLHRASSPARPTLRLCPGCGCDSPPPGRAAAAQNTAAAAPRQRLPGYRGPLRAVSRGQAPRPLQGR